MFVEIIYTFPKTVWTIENIHFVTLHMYNSEQNYEYKYPRMEIQTDGLKFIVPDIVEQKEDINESHTLVNPNNIKCIANHLFANS